MRAVLIVSSTRLHVDPQEVLRLQDTASVLCREGFAVDILAPRVTALLTAALDPAARIFTVPEVPFSRNPPPRPSLRRFAAATLMFLRGVFLASRRDYDVLHGFNDGAATARAIAAAAVRRLPFIAEVHRPFSRPGVKSPRLLFACAAERAALRRAAAVLLPDAATQARFGGRLPKARVSLIPDPHSDLEPSAFTLGEFSTALGHVYDYVLRPRT